MYDPSSMLARPRQSRLPATSSSAIQGSQNAANCQAGAWTGSAPLTSMVTSTPTMTRRWSGTT